MRFHPAPDLTIFLLNILQITDEETNEFLDFGDHTYNDTTFEATDETKYDTSHH